MERDTIRHLRIEQKLNINQVIDVIVSQQEKSKPPSLSALLVSHSQQIMDLGDEYLIRTNRSCIWNEARVFYKRAITTSPEMLRKPLMIEFSGEEGTDAGALLFEFFQAVLRKVDEECFEGSERRRMPRCHWGSAVELEMAGAMIAHSMLQGGPGLPCLHPVVFHSMVSEDLHLTSLEASELPTTDDIP